MHSICLHFTEMGILKIWLNTAAAARQPVQDNSSRLNRSKKEPPIHSRFPLNNEL
jgi:hypothetical protein